MMAARRPMQTRPASTADAGAYVDKAREFLRGAEDSLGLGNRVAAAGNAVHAGIDAADCHHGSESSGCVEGRTLTVPGSSGEGRWRGGAEGGTTSPPAPPLKNRAKYDPDPIAAPEAKARSRRRYAWCESPSKQCDRSSAEQVLAHDRARSLLLSPYGQSPTAQIQARSGALAGNLGAWRSHALPVPRIPTASIPL